MLLAVTGVVKMTSGTLLIIVLQIVTYKERTQEERRRTADFVFTENSFWCCGLPGTRFQDFS